MVSRLIKTLFLWLCLAGSAFGAPSIANITGTLFNGSGSPLTNATVIFNTPQQTVAGNVIGPSILSTRTNSSGAITPITLVQNSVVMVTINSGMVIVGVVPGATAADISQVLTGTVLTGNSVEVNGVGLLATATINFENGSGVTVTNPSAGNIQFAVDGSSITGIVTVPHGGTGIASGTSGGVPYFSSGTTIASSGALTANLPVIGGGSGTAPTVGTVSGNTTEFVTTTGAQTNGHCVSIDANGNHIDSGVVGCGGSGGGFANIFLLR